MRIWQSVVIKNIPITTRTIDIGRLHDEIPIIERFSRIFMTAFELPIRPRQIFLAL